MTMGPGKDIIYASIPSVWQTFSAYEKGDVVKYPANGGYYYIKIRDYSPTEKRDTICSDRWTQ